MEHESISDQQFTSGKSISVHGSQVISSLATCGVLVETIYTFAAKAVACQ